MKLDSRPLLLALCSLVFVGGVVRPLRSSAPRETEPTRLASALSKQPMRFEENVGQPGAEGRFVGHAKGLALALGDEAAVLTMRRQDETSTRLSLSVVGGRKVAPVASDLLPTKVSYLLGRDTSKWRRNVASFGKVTYPGVLDGVDLVFHGEEGQLEYDFVVAPGVDPARIAMNIEGGRGLSLTEAGDLAIATGSGTLVQERPRVYQRGVDGKAQGIRARYRLADDGKVAFELGAYDRDRPLVIDPVIGYSTFIGGTANDDVTDLVVRNGEVFFAGQSEVDAFSPSRVSNLGGAPPLVHDFAEGRQSYRDAMVGKLTSDGRLAFVTFYGGSDEDIANGIAVDDAGRILVVGVTKSTDMKTTLNAWQPELAPLLEMQYGYRDGFLVSLPPDGSELTYATYVDARGLLENEVCFLGDCSAFEDTLTSIVVQDGHVYAGSLSYGALYDPEATWNFLGYAGGPVVFDLTVPVDGTTPGAVVNHRLFDETPTFQASLYLSLAAKNGNVYLGSDITPSPTLETTTGFLSHGRNIDAYIAVLDASLAVQWSSFLGNPGYDVATSIVADDAGHVFVTGALGEDSGCAIDCERLPTIGGVTVSQKQQTGAFVAHIDPSRTGPTSLVWLRQFDGPWSMGASIAVDSHGRTVMARRSLTREYGNQWDLDTVVSVLSADGTTDLYSQRFGSDANADVPSRLVLVEEDFTIYLGGRSQPGPFPPETVPFPTFSAAQPMRAGRNDGFLMKLTSSMLLSPPVSRVAPGTKVALQVTGGIGSGYTFLQTANGSGSTLTLDEDDVSKAILETGPTPGLDVVRVTDAIGIVSEAKVTVAADPDPTVPVAELVVAATATSVAPKGSVTLTASGGKPPYAFGFSSNASNGSVGSSGQYVAGARGSVTDSVRVTDDAGQSKLVSIRVTEGISIEPSTATLAQKQTLHFTAKGGSGTPWEWSADGGTITADGDFTAPASSVVVTIAAKDRNGNVASENVAVGTAVGLAPLDVVTFPKGTVKLQAFGGAPVYQYTIITGGPRGGTLDAVTGLYTATSAGITDTVDAKDSLGNHAITTVTVGPGLAMSPSSASVLASAPVAFAAAGGSGLGYTFTVETNVSGASIDANGLYLSGANGGTDVVKLVDSVGNEARATITVAAAATPAPASNSSTSGASGSASSGSTLTPSTPRSAKKGDDGCRTTGSASAPSPAAFAAILGLLALRRRKK